MYPRIMHIYGPLWINSYGTMIALGVLLFLACTYWHPIRKSLLPGDLYLNSLFIGFLSAVVGGRILFILFNLSSYDSFYEIFYPWIGGFSLFGSIICILTVVPVYLKRKNVKVLSFFDFIVIYVPILQSVSRLGCFLAGCCYGAPTTVPWAVTFSSTESLAPTGVPLHPTQLYLAISSLLIFLILISVSKKLYKRPGSILFLYLFLESFSRFASDFWRGNQELFLGPFTSMQLIVGVVGLVSLALFLIRGKK